MSIWPILAVGVLTALVGLRLANVRQLFDQSRRKTILVNNKDELRRSLDALIDFLSKHEQSGWTGILEAIRNDLQSPTGPAAALARLSDIFGGMGSLNDLVFEGADADQEGSRLMDAVFRDMKLYFGSAEDRLQWSKLEDEHKDDLPPRIKHAFPRD